MHRKEYNKALAVLVEEGDPHTAWNSDYEIQTAKRFEQRFPEKVLMYHLSPLGKVKTNAQSIVSDPYDP